METKRLFLRPVVATDAADLFKIYGDPATNTFNPAGPYPDMNHASSVLERWVAHWHKHGFGNWAISLQADAEKIIGFGGLNFRHFAGIAINNLGYRFATEAWGKGLATEFAQRTMQYGFNEIKLHEIAAVVRAGHVASQKVLQKAGMKYSREIHDVNDAPPSLLYSLAAQEWRKQYPGETL